MSSGKLEDFKAYLQALELFDHVVSDMDKYMRSPRLERLVSQQLASADSVCANIEEGYGRESTAEYRRFLRSVRLREGATVVCDSRYRLGDFAGLDGATPNEEEAEALLEPLLRAWHAVRGASREEQRRGRVPGSGARGRLAAVCAAPWEEDPGIDPKVWECLHIAHCFERASEFDLIHNSYDFLPLTYTSLVDTPVVTTIQPESLPLERLRQTFATVPSPKMISNMVPKNSAV